MNYERAKALVEEVLDLANRLDVSMLEVSGLFPESEMAPYRQYAGRAIGYMFADVLQPIFRLFPQLEPENFKKEAAETPPPAFSNRVSGRLSGNK